MALSRLVAIPRATIRSDEDALVPGFFVDQHTNDRCIVFVPSVPTPMAGALYIIATSRVHRLNLPAINGNVMQCISKWGSGSDALVAALDAKNRTSTEAAIQETSHNNHDRPRTAQHELVTGPYVNTTKKIVGAEAAIAAGSYATPQG